jgi:hypothetical protein
LQGLTLRLQNKYLPISICVRRNEILEPLLLRKESYSTSRTKRQTLNDDVVRKFAESTAKYIRDVERACGVAIRRIAIDAPSDQDQWFATPRG